MTKMRVHELAKELGMENKELIDLLHKKNVEVSNHMSSIEDNIADEIRKEKNTRSEGKSEGEEAPKKKMELYKTYTYPRIFSSCSPMRHRRQ